MTVANHFLGFSPSHASLITTSLFTALATAFSTLAPGGFTAGQASLWGVFSNRSLAAKRRNKNYDDWVEDPRFKPPKNAKLSTYDCHVDPRVRAFVTFDSEGSATGAIGTVSCHPTSLGNQVNYWSPDWVGVAKAKAGSVAGVSGGVSGAKKGRAGKTATGAVLVPTFPIGVMQACAGDVSPLPICGGLGAVEVRAPMRRPMEHGTELKEVVGGGVGDAMGNVIKHLQGEATSRQGKKGGKKGGENRTRDAWNVESATSMWKPGTVVRPTMGIATMGGAACGPTKGIYERVGDGMPSNTLAEGHPQYPKTPVPGLEFIMKYGVLGRVPTELPVTVVVLNERLAIATVPGEPTVTTGARIEERIVAEVLGGEGECIVLGFAGEYAGYWVTPEEYDEQLYEGSSALWGRESSKRLEDELVRLGLEARGAN